MDIFISMENRGAQISGGCLCGKIRYQASGQPSKLTHCHCEDCRRSSAAAFVTWVTFLRNEFTFTKGCPRDLLWAERFRSFCGDCGTPLTFRASIEADEIDVTVCSLDQPEKLQPADHTWIEDQLPWVKLCDGLPTFPKKRTE